MRTVLGGLAIEVDIPDDEPLLAKVDYVPEVAVVNPLALSPDEMVRKVLTWKYSHWEYEKEVRILSDDRFFSLPQNVKRVILRFRMSDTMEEAFLRICRPRGIEVLRTTFDGMNVISEPILR